MRRPFPRIPKLLYNADNVMAILGYAVFAFFFDRDSFVALRRDLATISVIAGA